MKRLKTVPALLLVLCFLAAVFAGCSPGETGEDTGSPAETDAGAGQQTPAEDDETAGSPSAEEDTGEEQKSSEDTVPGADDMFTDRDLDPGYDEDEAVRITLGSDTAGGDGVSVSDSGVTITKEGVYVLTGTLSDGSVIVDAGGSDKVQLVLDGADITSSSSAAILVENADKVFITLAADSENTLRNGGEFSDTGDDSAVDAAVFSRDDLTVNGSGSLAVESPAGNGITSKDDLVLTGGTVEISCAGHGLEGKESVRVADGTFSLIAGKDGIHSAGSDDGTLGFVYIRNGSFTVESQGDGISACSSLEILDGDFALSAGGGSANGSSSSAPGYGQFGGWEGWGGWSGWDGGQDGDQEGGQDGEQEGGQEGNPEGDQEGGPEGDQNGNPEGDQEGGPEGDQDGGQDGSPEGDQEGGPEGGQDGDQNGGQDGEQYGGQYDGQGGEQDGGLFGGRGGNRTGGQQEGGRTGGFGYQNQAATTSDDTETSTSMKGLKGGESVEISGGTFTIDSADDAVHSNGSITVSGGTFSIATGDDGIHADESLTFTNGTVTISECYEGLEALNMEISGGSISLTASDDGLNAAGGSDTSGTGGRDSLFGGGGWGGSSGGSVVISGGDLYLQAGGDGIDSNGSLEISGGNVTICGPTSGDTATLDYNTSAAITGGTFIGSGASTMAQTFSENSQGVLAIRFDAQEAGTEVVITDSTGQEILRYSPALSFAVFIYSDPGIVSGETYTVTVGGMEGEVTAG